jgi:hypothetical protein
MGKKVKTEAASSSEISVNFYQTTRRYTSDLHGHRRENLKSNTILIWTEKMVSICTYKISIFFSSKLKLSKSEYPLREF